MRLIHILLLKLPPETAHHLGMWLLRLYQRLLFSFFKEASSRKPELSNIKVSKMPTLRFASRIGLAAGFDKDAQVYALMGRMGFGFVEVGTVTPRPQTGNNKPRLWRVGPDGLRNRMGFNNVGLDRFEKHLQAFPKQSPVFANIGKNKDTPNENALDDYKICAHRLAPWVDGLVVNLSSPNTKGLRDLQNDAFLESLAGALPPGIPTLIKLAPDLENKAIQQLCEQIAREERFVGVVLTNTSREIAFRLARTDDGGYSGPALLARSLECVSIARKAMRDKVVIGVGGVSTRQNVREMREAGADLIEVYTAFVYQGPRLISKLSRAFS